ncbi:hypothetical protein GQX73_g8308 [Xylaria multiplex]|uniref:Epoxide hydrolase N-terminal domain-containing protein n=1 Tax=Xylaria multiplex TaxID=323545 RepID=A0A7C8MN23_9PEZI|nr:hypothetical protein GQX73_g8308 [Xylaria multiplex]
MSTRILVASASQAIIRGASLTRTHPNLCTSSLSINTLGKTNTYTIRQYDIRPRIKLPTGARLFSSSSTPAKKDAAINAGKNGSAPQSRTGSHQTSAPSEEGFKVSFGDLGMNRTTKFVVYAVLGIFGTIETIFWCKTLVSSRYLNLTKQKLEIARLPHELDEPKSKDWWQPKSQVEPLIDFWLEQYQWRDQEEILNGLPQFLSPPLAQPKLKEAPLAWARWSIARYFEASVLGYRSDDFSALRQSGWSKKSTAATSPKPHGLGITEPNTLAYALCDSPTGLLVFVMKGLRLFAPQKEFTPTEIINFTQFSWLPGPESAMRFWAHCARHPEKTTKNASRKPYVALTVFLGSKERAVQGSSSGNAQAGTGVFDETNPLYSCPGWAKTRYNVLYTNRVSGKPGLLSWERPEIIAIGVRGLAAAVLRVDRRLKPSGAAEVAPRVQAVAVAETAAPEEQPSSPGPSGSVPEPGLLAPPNVGGRLEPVREISDDTKVTSSDTLAAKAPSPIVATPSPAQSAQQPAATTQGDQEKKALEPLVGDTKSEETQQA